MQKLLNSALRRKKSPAPTFRTSRTGKLVVNRGRHAKKVQKRRRRRLFKKLRKWKLKWTRFKRRHASKRAKRKTLRTKPVYTYVRIAGKSHFVRGRFTPQIINGRAYWTASRRFWDKPRRRIYFRMRKRPVTRKREINLSRHSPDRKLRVYRDLLSFSHLDIKQPKLADIKANADWKARALHYDRIRPVFTSLETRAVKISRAEFVKTKLRRKQLKFMRRRIQKQKREETRDQFFKLLPVVKKRRKYARLSLTKSASRAFIEYNLESRRTMERNKVRLAVAKRKVSSFNYSRMLAKITTSQNLGIGPEKLARQLKLFSHRTLDFASARVAAHFQTQPYPTELRTRRVASITCQVPIRVSPVRMERQTLRRATNEIHTAVDPVNTILDTTTTYQYKLDEKSIEVHFEIEDALIFANRFRNLSWRR